MHTKTRQTPCFTRLRKTSSHTSEKQPTLQLLVSCVLTARLLKNSVHTLVDVAKLVVGTLCLQKRQVDICACKKLRKKKP
mmetsp:Transcript_9420/g.27032  ORF Transcript_9420/g.27032 Transcript_9420/m.27032 type:complete len:80 (+) Transcript_9420:381-620(+)